MSVFLLFALTWLHDGRDAAAGHADPPPGSAMVIMLGAAEGWDWRDPLRVEPFWFLGALWAERLIPNTVLAYAPDVPTLVDSIDDRLRSRALTRIGRVEFWCHGDTGYFRIGPKRYRAKALTEPSPRLAAAWERLRCWLSPGAILHFRSCATLHSGPGQEFAAAASRYFNADGRNVTIVGYTRPTGLTQPGGHALRPGELPTWSAREGDAERTLADLWVAGRDLLRIVTGGGYDMLPAFAERVLPALRSWTPAPAADPRGAISGGPAAEAARQDEHP